MACRCACHSAQHLPIHPSGSGVPVNSLKRPLPPAASVASSPVPSVELSSITISSSSGQSWAITDRTAFPIEPASLRAGMITDTRGPEPTPAAGGGSARST